MTRIIFRGDGFARTTPLSGWAFGLWAFGFAALGVLVLLFGAALILLMAPVAIGAALFARWRLGRLLRDLARRSNLSANATKDQRVIDAEYRVLREDELS